MFLVPSISLSLCQLVGIQFGRMTSDSTGVMNCGGWEQGKGGGGGGGKV